MGKLSALYAVKNYVKRIVSPNHEKLQGSRDQRQHLGDTRNLRNLTTEMLNTRHVFRSFSLPAMPVCHRHLSRWGKNTSSLLNYSNRHCCLKGKISIQYKAWEGQNVRFHSHPSATYKQNFLSSAEEDAVVMPWGKVKEIFYYCFVGLGFPA